MPHFLGFVLSLLLCVNSFSAIESGAQSQASPPMILLEATSTLHGIGGYQSQLLLVRLTDDGKVEWDKLVGPRATERQTSSVSEERVSEIKRALGSIDESSLHGTMGPYHIYMDTSVELQIHMTVRKAEVAFSVMNPWPPTEFPGHKRMPKDVRVVVCEIDKLHAQVADIPVTAMCKATALSH
jgi:hypothetical protein